MAPFDANYINDGELELSGFADSSHEKTKISPRRTARSQGLGAAYPHVRDAWRRVNLAERLLDSVDDDAIFTSLVFICVYVGLMNAL